MGLDGLLLGEAEVPQPWAAPWIWVVSHIPGNPTQTSATHSVSGSPFTPTQGKGGHIPAFHLFTWSSSTSCGVKGITSPQPSSRVCWGDKIAQDLEAVPT